MKLKPATTALVLINVLVALIGLWPGAMNVMLPAAAFIPARIFGSAAMFGEAATLIPVWLTPFTASFIHLGWFDLLWPFLLLLLLGNALEMSIGSRAIVILYFGGALSSAVALTVVAGGSAEPFTGSFNAVSAIIGCYLMLQTPLVQQYWMNLSGRNSRLLQLTALWFVINIAWNLYMPWDQIVPLVASAMAAFIFGCLAAEPLHRWYKRTA
ncbi:rhomboid family intramembrane serine protease [Sphingorhabdus arenilitoris]|uniref:Rhomboid family intramembrane serine protease n=1 Tax=Sphingorhabdus arenilitoris TaxID=1490041 RepID=A0ABV8RGL5_9SPHN